MIKMGTVNDDRDVRDGRGLDGRGLPPINGKNLLVHDTAAGVREGRSDADYDDVMTQIVATFQSESRDQAEAYEAMIDGVSGIRRCQRRLSEATQAEEQAYRAFRTSSVEDQHHAPLPRQWTIAGLALIPEWYACYLGAEALGQGTTSTALFATIILVVLGGCEYWYDSGVRHRNRGQSILALALLIAVVASLGVLRFCYGWIVQGDGDVLGAVALAGALTVVTVALVGIGCAALQLSESSPTWARRRELLRARKVAESAKASLARAKDRQIAAIGRFCRLVEPAVILRAAGDKHLSERRLQDALSRRLAPMLKATEASLP
jgi:hypothetical protein